MDEYQKAIEFLENYDPNPGSYFQEIAYLIQGLVNQLQDLTSVTNDLNFKRSGSDSTNAAKSWHNRNQKGPRTSDLIGKDEVDAEMRQDYVDTQFMNALRQRK